MKYRAAPNESEHRELAAKLRLMRSTLSDVLHALSGRQRVPARLLDRLLRVEHHLAQLAGELEQIAVSVFGRRGAAFYAEPSDAPGVGQIPGAPEPETASQPHSRAANIDPQGVGAILPTDGRQTALRPHAKIREIGETGGAL